MVCRVTHKETKLNGSLTPARKQISNGTTQSSIHYTRIPPQHRRRGTNLFGYPQPTAQGGMEAQSQRKHCTHQHCALAL